MQEYRYIIDSTSLKQRYDRITAIITALENQILLGISNSDVISYSLDDGQTRISTNYRSADQVAKAITEYEKIRNRILFELTGSRIVRLADAGSVQSNRSVQ